MLVDESVQTSRDMERKEFEERVIKEGMQLWKKQRQFENEKKLQEQREMRDMLERYWPWGRASDAKPRGLRNLRLEELFPNKDYMNAKRFVGTLDSGRGGGGAPLFRGGKQIARTREDPMLRFQFGSKDLRRCVDNTLRYKTNKGEQEEYKKDLDKLVEQKKHKDKLEKTECRQFHQEQFLKSPPWGRRGPGGRQWRKPNAIGLNFLKSLGWSTEKTLKHLENEAIKNKLSDLQKYNNFKNMTIIPPNKVIKIDPVSNTRKQFLPVGKNRKLSPLFDDKDEGVELVALMAKDRKYPYRIPLCSSDVTSEKKMGGTCVWNRQGSAYLKELAAQMIRKRQLMKEVQDNECDSSQRHFSTWDGFWGRPGNGAPLPEIRKRCLDQMLYPKMTPIGVH